MRVACVARVVHVSEIRAKKARKIGFQKTRFDSKLPASLGSPSTKFLN